MKSLLRLAALAFALALAGAAWAQSGDLQEISRLLKQGQHAQALDRVNALLVTNPRDAQGRFLKGLILTEQNKIPEAIEVFTRLSQDYPELPEPYNNLAVLYAAQGQYEKARQSLETSIRTHPSYATAYENLGDVYTKLASQAYDKALQFDTSNTAAQTKLSLIRDLLTTTGRAPRPGSRSEPPRVALAAANSAKSGAISQKPATPPAAESKAAAAQRSGTPPPPETKSPPPAAKAPPKTAEKQAGSAAKDAPEEIIKAVRGWAAAWSKKDADAYLSHYAKDFKTPKGEPRGDWEALRRQRISAAKTIEVSIASPKVTMIDNNNASVTFRQSYRSDSLKAMSTKTLTLVRTNGKWLIRQEQVGS
ncbi:MAG: tetratricopeptide repeat protein [Betaproteobacteria bacterium]|nr:tetratricopeptide repeat protein [Betaproteobacteria bacterium]